MNKKFIITSVILVWLTWSFLDELVEDWGQIENAPEKLEEFFDEEVPLEELTALVGDRRHSSRRPVARGVVDSSGRRLSPRPKTSIWKRGCETRV